MLSVLVVGKVISEIAISETAMSTVVAMTEMYYNKTEKNRERRE